MFYLELVGAVVLGSTLGVLINSLLDHDYLVDITEW